VVEVALEGEVLEVAVGQQQGQAPGASYVSLLLMPTRRFSTMSSRPKP
jgi:hypothetical protein